MALRSAWLPVTTRGLSLTGRRSGLDGALGRGRSGLVGRSESWLSQVERDKRGVDSHSVLLGLAEVLRVDLEELTGSADQNETGRSAHPTCIVW